LAYLEEVVQGRSTPERATWFVWTILGVIALLTQKSLGATSSLWFVGLQTAGVALIFLLSISHGSGGFNKFDYSALALSALGILLWILSSNPLFSLVMVVLVRSIAISTTVKKTYAVPRSEAVLPWIIYAMSAILAIISVGEWSFALLLYPIYVLCADSSVIIAKILGRHGSPHRA
jgi:hypothetical protein